MPDLHVVAAGSLLDFSLCEFPHPVSIPGPEIVSRIGRGMR